MSHESSTTTCAVYGNSLMKIRWSVVFLRTVNATCNNRINKLIEHLDTTLSEKMGKHQNESVRCQSWPNDMGDGSIKTVFQGMGLYIKKILLWDRLIFIVGIHLLVIRRPYFETAPTTHGPYVFNFGYNWFPCCSRWDVTANYVMFVLI